MSDRLPRPFLHVDFDPSSSLADCLRSARNYAQKLQAGIWFKHEKQKYLVQPEMPLDMVLAMADEALGESVKEHLEEHAP